MKRKRLFYVLIALAALVGAALVVGACSGGRGGEQAGPPAATATGAGGKAEVGLAEPGLEDFAAAEPAPPPAEVDVSGAQLIEIAPLPALGPRVIQTASLTLSIERGKFDETVDRARTIAAGLGGFVTSSSASQGPEERLVRGTLVVRVPQPRYADAMSQLSKLGRVQAREESGTDVSQQYVDLEARERHLEALERQLLGFLEKTATVADALIVQERLNQVQLELEQIRGQLRYLDDQTSFSTITLSVAERGVPVAAPKDGGWGITDAWSAAADGFLKVIGGVFVGLATAGPILAALALAFLGGRLYLKRRREAQGPTGGDAGVPRPTPQA